MRLYLGIVGVALALAAIVLAARRLAALVAGQSTMGRVVGHRANTLDDSLTFHAIVEFRDQTGARRRFTAGAGGPAKRPPEGAAIPVRYLRDHPDIAFVPTFMHMWAAPVGFALLAGGALWAWWRG